jgi:predicted 3-demethylubiquinone-9 3-methyltransferase (glyoxalase superfamily)
MVMQKINPFLWFNDNAEEAVNFYASVFPDAKIGKVLRYPKETPGLGGKVLTIEFELFGQKFVALNGGPKFKFNESVSFVINCKSQEEVDHYWNRLTDGGEESQCSWLKDRYGLSWQVVPNRLIELLNDKDPAKSSRVMQAMMQMKKIDIATLEEAYAEAAPTV